MEDLYWLGFSAFSGIGPVKFAKLVREFGNAENTWKSPVEEIIGVIGESWGEKFDDFRKKHDLEGHAEYLRKKGIGYLLLKDEKYPELLKKLHPDIVIASDSEAIFRKNKIAAKPAVSRNDVIKSVFYPPFVLYYKGDPTVLQSGKILAVVGTRKVTSYGKEVTRNLVTELVGRNVTIVSGLAFGVDAVAHATTVENNGRTVAVLGGGVDVCIPAEHQRLYNQILEQRGCIVSSCIPEEKPIKGSFPARNRIVAGLSQGVLVTEGAEDSGALITANFAKEFGRPVFAVPGPITSSLSKGPHYLIQKGATIVTSASEVLDKLGIMEPQLKTQKSKVKSKKGESKEEQKILDLLQIGPLHFDDIVRKIKQDSKTIGSLLSLMELKGMIKSLSDGKYTLNF